MGIVVLYHGGHDPCRLLAEVYDHAQPAAQSIFKDGALLPKYVGVGRKDALRMASKSDSAAAHLAVDSSGVEGIRVELAAESPSQAPP